jgi:hypothetical protein
MSPAGDIMAYGSREGRGLTERLRAFMRAHDLSLEELARLLHTEPRTLADWFRRLRTFWLL